MRRSLIDVIVPTRNRLDFALQAVESVRSQVFQDWRLIVVDDASDDGSLGELRQRVEGDERVDLVLRERQGGAQAARERGLEASSAPYVAVLDSDDLWHANKLKLQMAVFEAPGNLRVEAVLCGHQWMDGGGAAGPARVPQVDGPIPPFLTNNMSTLVLSREALARSGGFLPQGTQRLRTCDQIEFYLRLARNGVVACSVEQILVTCRHHDLERASSALGTKLAADELKYVLGLYEDWLHELAPEQLADLRAKVGLRYLGAGRRREGLAHLLAAVSSSGPRYGAALVRRYGAYATKAAIVGR